MKALIVVDMQYDFIDGALGTEEARSIVENVRDKVAQYRASQFPVIYTQDTTARIICRHRKAVTCLWCIV